MNRWHRLRSLLPVGSLVLFGALAVALLSGCTREAVAEIKTYDGINAIRTSQGLPPLVADPALVEIARIRSRDMAASGYFSHNPPNGCNYVCLMDQRGVPHAWAGENIAWNRGFGWERTAEEAVKMWRNSPGHLANILGCHYTRFGTGVAQASDGTIYYTMIFDGNRAC